MPTLLYGFSIPELSRMNSGGGYNLRRIHDQAAECSVRHAERPVSKRNQARCYASSVHVSINPEVPLSLASSAPALAAQIGRASLRERVCQTVLVPGGSRSL